MGQPIGPPLEVAGMIRISKGKEDKISLDRQREDIEFTCSVFNLVVVKWFSFVNVSGAAVQHKTRFDELQTYLSQPHVAGLVIPSVDRCSREATFERAAQLTRPLTPLLSVKRTKRLLR